MKRILGLIMCGVLVLGVTGCGKEETKENNNSTIKNDNKVEEQTKLYDEIVECLDDSNNSYIKAYLKNNDVFKVEFYSDQRTGNEKIPESEFKQGLKAAKTRKHSQGYNNIEILEDGLLFTITEEDGVWDTFNGTRDDVYKKIHDNTAEFSSFSCTTKK